MLTCRDRFVRDDFTPQLVREFLDYDAEAGIFVWKSRDEKWFADNRAFLSWNAKFSGKRADKFAQCYGYSTVRVWRMLFGAHRVAWAHHYGCWPTHQIDHIDGVRSNNKITNLRDVTPAENMKNVSMRSDNTSGVTGVLYRQDIGKWQAGIGVSGEHKHLGVYVRKEDAVAARIDAECRYGFSERHGTPS